MKEIIHTKEAPAAVGPYSQAVSTGSLLFVSGQLPMDPVTMEMPKDVQAQAKQSLTNLESILKEAGLGLKDVVKTSVFIKNMDDFGAVNEIYAQFFQDLHPARSCVEVARLPKDALVEVEAIATF